MSRSAPSILDFERAKLEAMLDAFSARAGAIASPDVVSKACDLLKAAHEGVGIYEAAEDFGNTFVRFARSAHESLCAEISEDNARHAD